MEPIKTRFLLKTPKFLGLDIMLDIALLVFMGPFFLLLPKFSSFYMIGIAIIHLILWRILKDKEEKYLQNRIRFYLYDQKIWMKNRDIVS